MKDPVKNLPKAAVSALISENILYMGATFSYFIVVPVDSITPKNGIIASLFFQRTLGSVFGGTILPLMISSAAFSCSMTLCFANSRLIFKASQDGILPPVKYLSKVSRFETPIWALFLNMIISLVILLVPPPGNYLIYNVF